MFDEFSFLEVFTEKTLTVLRNAFWGHARVDEDVYSWWKQQPPYAEPLYEIFRTLVDLDGRGYLETGTGKGFSSLLAALCGFETVISIDIDRENINRAMKNASELRHSPFIYYFNGDSRMILPLFQPGNFSLVYVDGGHLGITPVIDIMFAVRLARNLVLAHDVLSDNPDCEASIQKAIEPYEHIILDRVHNGLALIKPEALSSDDFQRLVEPFLKWRTDKAEDSDLAQMETGHARLQAEAIVREEAEGRAKWEEMQNFGREA